MKPLFSLLTVVVIATACSKTKPEPAAAAPVSKQISFDVFAAQDYSNTSQSPYGYHAASVKLSIEKLVKNGGSLQPLWDTTFSFRPLAEFPMQPQQFKVQKWVLVVESNEELQVNYEVLYGSVYNAPQRFGHTAWLPAGQMGVHLNVEL